jgi:microcystin-dependent protein
MASALSLPSFAAKVENLVDQNGQNSSQFLPPGIIFPYAGAGGAPAGYLLCDGSAVSQTIYPRLFAVLQFSWGNPGGGSFNLPNGQGAFLRGTGTNGVHVGPASVGQVQSQATAKNGLANATSSITSATAAGQTVTGTAAGQTVTGVTEQTTPPSAQNIAGNANSYFGAPTFVGHTWNSNNRQLSISGTGAASAVTGTGAASAVTGTVAAQNITGDTETRPNSFGVQYIIKI